MQSQFYNVTSESILMHETLSDLLPIYINLYREWVSSQPCQMVELACGRVSEKLFFFFATTVTITPMYVTTGTSMAAPHVVSSRHQMMHCIPHTSTNIYSSIQVHVIVHVM